MAAPTLTASLDKTTYGPGDQMVLTVNSSAADTRAVSVAIVVTDLVSGVPSQPVTVTATIDPVKATDSSHVWVRQAGSTPGVATLKATA